MRNFLAKAGLAVLVLIGGVAASAPAQAGGVDVDVRIGAPYRHHRPVVIVRPPVVYKPAPVVVVRPGYGRCQPGLAVQKAYNRGLNKVAVEKVTANRVVVSGKSRGVWMKMAFANVRGCPRL